MILKTTLKSILQFKQIAFMYRNCLVDLKSIPYQKPLQNVETRFLFIQLLNVDLIQKTTAASMFIEYPNVDNQNQTLLIFSE